MVDNELILTNIDCNSDFLFAADLEKNLWRNIFRIVKYYFRKHILVSQLNETPERNL